MRASDRGRRRGGLWGAAAALVLVLPLVSGSAGAGEETRDGWRRARPPGCYLSALMPPNLTDRSGVRPTVVGDVHHRTLTADVGDVELSLTVSTLPRAAVLLSTDGMVLRKARRELVGHYDGQATEWSTCELHGITCRTLRYDLGGGDDRTGRATLFLSDGVLVVLNVVHPDTSEGRTMARAFLRSTQP